jgi:pyrroloquinoline quinone (PQQ) biosynthesis protein C
MMNPQGIATERAWSVEESRRYLEQLALTVYKHEALNNGFYEIWMSRRLELPQVAVFVRNYGEINRAFPGVLGMVLAATENIAARTEYASTLYSEMGNGVYEKVHSVLFDAFAQSLAEQFGDRKRLEWSNLIAEMDALPQTHALIEGWKRIYAGPRHRRRRAAGPGVAGLHHGDAALRGRAQVHGNVAHQGRFP